MSHVLVNPVFAVIGTFGVRLLSVVGACLLLGAGCASQAIGYRPVGADGFGYSGDHPEILNGSCFFRNACVPLRLFSTA